MGISFVWLAFKDGTSSEASSPPSSPKIERSNPAGPDGNNSILAQKKRQRKHSVSAMYTGPGGATLPRDILTNVTQFQKKQKKGTIDVWWLYDDGGLTLLLPYLLTTRSQFSGCTLRIFSLASRKDELGREQRKYENPTFSLWIIYTNDFSFFDNIHVKRQPNQCNELKMCFCLFHFHSMAALLSKFRIDYSDVIVIHDITKKAQEKTKKEFEALIAPFKSGNSDDGTSITDAELMALREKTNRHLRLRELLLTHSKESTFIVMYVDFHFQIC